ncbi:MAG: D-glycerate dehydrogenase [Elusimicrobia bacterium]|nr:D-glycerate dehydrogenase [Elusimicrobiota bacterium]MDE2424299.1 D-glycerate dehydrogenase [Elusimicrobiota bacterium]
MGPPGRQLLYNRRVDRPKVLVTRAIPEEAFALLEKHFKLERYDKHAAMPRALLLRRIRDKDGLLCILTDKVDVELLEAAPRLKAVATYSVGFDHVDVKACALRRVVVSNTPGVLTETTADFTWALLLAASRRVVEGDAFMRAGRYKGWDPMMFLGGDVHGKTLGIVGFGRIGQAVARRAQGFGMKVLYYDRQRLFTELESQFGARYCELDELLRGSDFVTLHCVLDASTFHLIDARAFALMRRSACLVNAARGPIVDEKALVAALRAGRIRGAGLDVYELEPKTAAGLSRLRNVVLAPHLASASLETRTKMGLMAAQGLVDALVRRKAPEHAVDRELCRELFPAA